MLFLPPGTARLQRVHGAYVSDDEVKEIIKFLKTQGKPKYDTKITNTQKKDREEENKDIEYDEKYDEALAFIAKTRKASISSLQRQFRIGYNRAARIIETMEKEGVVSPQEGVKPREVLISQFFK